MTKVLCIHGIGQEYEAEETLTACWVPALCGGVSNAGGRLDPSEVRMCFYGNLFRPQEETSKSFAGNSVYALKDDKDDFERKLLATLAEASAGEAEGKLLERPINAMLQLVAKAPFFGEMSQQLVVWLLRQVRWYLDDFNFTRQLAQNRLIKAIADDTSVLVAHSLGTVIAYEVLYANADLPVRTLVTLGSPLGNPVVRPRVVPSVSESPAPWPGSVKMWFNIADRTDIVAFEKRLAHVFGDRVQDSLVYNGATIHDVRPYLTARETGRAIIAAKLE